MNPFRKRKERRKLLDVHFKPLHQPRRAVFRLQRLVSRFWGSEEILDLRQNIWKQPEFRTILAFLMIGILLFSFQKIFTRAEVADFYPSNCLGTWQDPQNAQGEPETFRADATAKILSVSNSATYAGGESQIFCGGFIPGEYEASGIIKQVGITLVLQVGDIKEVSTPIEFQSTPTSTSDTLPPSSTETSSTEPIETPPLPEEPTAPELPTSTSSFLERLWETIIVSVFAQEENPPAPTPPLEPPPPAPEPTPLPQDTPQDAPSETPLPAPEPETVVAPPIFAPLLPIETPGETSSVPESVPPTPATSSEPVLVPPPSPDEHFLKVSYSVDGELWVEAGKIDPTNWPNFTFVLPVTSWDDLKKLQVRLEGIATNLPEPLPPVYLDGMLLEVLYELPPSFGSVATSTPSTADSQENSQPPKQKLVTFDPRSTHTCKIEPFSQTLTRGAAISYQVNLKPSRPLANFELVTGDLPSGITAAFDQSKGWTAKEQTLTVEALSTAQIGSFNIVVVYREQSEEGELLPNFCQLNLITK